MPLKSQVHIDSALTNISIAWMQDAEGFVADRVFPMIPVTKESGKYFEYNKGDIMRDEMKIRAPGTESAGGDYSVSTSSYLAEVRAFHTDVDDQIVANTDSPLSAFTDATNFVSEKAMINREVNFATNYMTTGIWTSNVTPATLWSAALSTPISDIQTGKTTILKASGRRVNKIVCGVDVFAALMNHADIIDRIKYANRDLTMVGIPELAALFQVDEFLVMTGSYNTAAEGATPVFVSINAKEMLLVHTTNTPSLMAPSAGYIFEWTGYTNMGSTGVSQFYEQKTKSTRIEIESAYDMKVVSADLGYLFVAVVA